MGALFWVPRPNFQYVEGNFLPHPSNVLAPSWVSYNSAESGHYLPGDSIRFYRLKTQSPKTALPLSPPHLMSATSPSCYLCFWPTGCKSEVPITGFLCSVNFLEQLSGLRKSLYSLVYWYITKIYNSGTADEEMPGARYWCRASLLLRVPLSPNLSVFINPELSKPSSVVWWRLHYINLTD